MTSQRKVATTVLQVIALVAVVSIALPVLMIVMMFVELKAFGTQHLMNGLDAIGLSKVLKVIFNALGING